jgi:tagatose 6-phosphate kinase
VSNQLPGTAKRVLAAGLSPAWQQIMVFDQFCVGEVNRAREVHRCASGKVLNVGMALAQLAATDRRCSTSVLSVIGPRTREMADAELVGVGARVTWIETKAETRTCTTILDRSTGETTELVENAPPISPEEGGRFQKSFAYEAASADAVVLTGSLPPGVSPKLYRDLLRNIECLAVLDIRGPELLDALECQPFCVKPNRAELAMTLGRPLETDNDLHTAMHQLNRRGARWVVVTQGAGPVWVSHERQVYRLTHPLIGDVVNPIGSGDCLAAGIASRLALGEEMLDAIAFGIACASANVMQLLPARLDMARVSAVFKQVEIAKP